MCALPAVDAAPQTVSPAATPPARRQPRTRLALLLGLGVLALHAVLINHLAPVGRLGNPLAVAAGRPVVAVLQMQVRSLPAPARVPTLPPALQTALQTAPQAEPQAAAPPARAATPAPVPAQAPATTPLATTPLAAGTMGWLAALPTRPLRDVTPLVGAAADDSDDAAEANTANSAAATGTAPPVYLTQVPSPTTLRYAVRLPNQAGLASLAWQHDGQRYQLQLDSRNSAGQPLLEQLSHGLLDSTGLAPDRFTDRRRGRGWRAANFRRDVGRISFSGPPVDYPAWPGAQDRLSWLVQLVAIQAAAAAAGQPLQPVRLFVVAARGGAALLRFEPITDTADLAPLQHWQHQPVLVDTVGGADRHDAQRIDLWLDPGLGHWPARLRYTQMRSGDQTEWLHLPGPPQPP